MPGKPRVAGPEVIAYAEKVKLDLTQVQGSGPGNTITRADAEGAHWERMRPKIAAKFDLDPSASWAEIKGALDSKLRPRAIAVGLEPTATLPEIVAAEEANAAEHERKRAVQQVVSSPSALASRVAGRGPAFALNPRVDHIRAEASAGRANAPAAAAPTLFASGDLPSFTASGIPPEHLLEAPWEARHAMAAAPTTAEAFAILADCQQHDNSSLEYSAHPGNAAYAERVNKWYQDSVTDDQIEAAFANDPLGAKVIEYERKSGLTQGDVPTSPNPF